MMPDDKVAMAMRNDPARAIDDPLATEADTTRRHAQQRPDHIAIIFNDRQTTYAELNRRSNQAANGVLRFGEPPAQRIAILDKNSDQFFEILFGIAKSGNVSLPLNWRLSAREIAHILCDAEAHVLFIGSQFAGLLPELVRHGAQLSQIIVLGEAADPAGTYLGWRDSQSDGDPHVAIDPDDAFIQLYTSGTTGNPKGVQISHGASMRMRRLEVSTGGAWTQWGPEDVAIVAMPNFHVGGTSWALQWLARGATCVVQAQVDPRAMLDAIDRYGVTHIFAVPTIMSMMLADETCAGRDYSRLKLIHYGAMPIAPTLLIRCIETFGTGFVQYYGMTETDGALCVLPPLDHRLDAPDLLKSCGRPYPMVDLAIIDAAGNKLATGQVGEVCVKTPCLMTGYWKQPEATANSMCDGYYRTGDAAFVDDQGYVHLVDRVKDMIVSGGENVYPVEVERALAEHPDIVEAAVIGTPDAHWGEAVKAIVVSRNAALTQRDIIDFLRDRIARYKMPKTVEFIDTLPRNGAGKVLKRTLRDQYAGQDIAR